MAWSFPREPCEHADLLIKGVVREYNGGECWYDVHPIMRDIPAFKDALTGG